MDNKELVFTNPTFFDPLMLMLPLMSDLDLMGSTLVPLLFLLGHLTIPFISALAPTTAKLRLLLNDPTLPFGGSTVLDKISVSDTLKEGRMLGAGGGWGEEGGEP